MNSSSLKTSVKKSSSLEDFKIGPLPLSPLGKKIFLDRYALKDGAKKTLKVGDTVIVVVDLKTGQREIGKIKEISKDKVKVELEDHTIVEQLIEYIDKPLETKPEQMVKRVAQGIAGAEKNFQKQKEWFKKFLWLMSEWKFVPAGRILTAAGTNQRLTYFNCFVLPSPHDSRQGIVKTLLQMMEIMSRGGGVGINISSLRPRHAYVQGVNGRSSGSVSWGELYSFVTGLIEQGGSRRGALMLILNDWHPDIFEFITVKQDMKRITNANISIGISDKFMEAVEKDQDWDLVFPDTQDPEYDELWDGDLEKWQSLGKPIIVYKTVKAREIWYNIIESAWKSAEPGIWFRDRANKMSNSWYYNKLVSTNPCGEQPLPPWGICNLGHINLARFVKNKKIDWEKLGQAVEYAVRFLDNVIDVTPYFFKENEKQEKSERRIGLGTIGLAELLIRLEIRYGSPECLQLIDKLYSFIATKAYLASTKLAQEKGSFPEFNKEKYLQGTYIKNLPSEVKETIREKGIRNVTLLTQAPTGTVATMVGTSTGIEPYYYWTYLRKSRLGTHEEVVKVYEEWRKKHPNDKMPSYFVTAQDLKPEEHAYVQAAIQRWMDSSISKTSNLPADYTVEDVGKFYELLFKLGCKGGTVYRDRSREEQILMLKEQQKEKAEILQPRTRPEVMSGYTYKIATGYGNMYVTINEDENGEPFEVFATIGKAGGFFAEQAEGICRMVSLALRSGIKVQEIITQLKGIRGPQPVWYQGEQILSLPDAIARVLERHLQLKSQQLSLELEKKDLKQPPLIENTPSNKNKVDIADLGVAPVCPVCGSLVEMSEGCITCRACGYSKCA